MRKNKHLPLIFTTLLIVIFFVAGTVLADDSLPHNPVTQSAGDVTWINAFPGGPENPEADLTNGGFEGPFPGPWGIYDQAFSAGTTFQQSGTTAPLSGLTVQPPPEGTYAGMIDVFGSGSHIVYQDFEVPLNSNQLSFALYYRNQASDFYVQNTLDFTVQPNQQVRVDLMDPTAPISSLDPADILLNIYQTNPGDPRIAGYNTVTANVEPFEGDTVRLRFASVNTENLLLVGIDDVRFVGPTAISYQAVAVSTTANWLPAGLLLLAVLMTGIVFVIYDRRMHT